MKKKYINLSIKISEISVKDVITTSGFDGYDQVFGGTGNTNTTSVNATGSMLPG